MLAIVDYGRGNLFSLSQALSHIGVPHEIIGDSARLLSAERVILPGVGAFGDTMNELTKRGLVAPLLEVARRGRPLLGICVGFQVLFDRGEEFGGHAGLGLLSGRVAALPRPRANDDAWRIPNVGWRPLIKTGRGNLMSALADDTMVYFVHSYAPVPVNDDVVSARLSFSGSSVVAAVESRNVLGVQFHPERSGPAGLEILRQFMTLRGH
jgi:glutamine amidotransferase